MRLIDADALIEKFNEKCDMATVLVDEKTAERFHTFCVLADAVDNAPTIDAEPVRHGHWKITKDGAAWCSACKRKMNPCQYGYPRCAMCGAKMDEVSADAT